MLAVSKVVAVHRTLENPSDFPTVPLLLLSQISEGGGKKAGTKAFFTPLDRIPSIGEEFLPWPFLQQLLVEEKRKYRKEFLFFPRFLRPLIDRRADPPPER